MSQDVEDPKLLDSQNIRNGSPEIEKSFSKELNGYEYDDTRT